MSNFTDRTLPRSQSRASNFPFEDGEACKVHREWKASKRRYWKSFRSIEITNSFTTRKWIRAHGNFYTFPLAKSSSRATGQALSLFIAVVCIKELEIHKQLETNVRARKQFHFFFLSLCSSGRKLNNFERQLKKSASRPLKRSKNR